MDKPNLHQYFRGVSIESFVVDDVTDSLGVSSKLAATIAIDKSPLMFVALDPSFIELIQNCYQMHKSINMKTSALTGLIVDVQPLE